MLKLFSNTKKDTKRSLWQDVRHAAIWAVAVFVGSSLLAMILLAILVLVFNN